MFLCTLPTYIEITCIPYLPTNLCYFGTYPSMYKVVYLDLHGQGGNSRVYKKSYQGGPKLWFINN